MRRVTQLDGAYSVDGRAFGPFRATEDRPYLEVPDALVNALGLNLHESDPQLIAQQATDSLRPSDTPKQAPAQVAEQRMLEEAFAKVPESELALRKQHRLEAAQLRR